MTSALISALLMATQASAIAATSVASQAQVQQAAVREHAGSHDGAPGLYQSAPAAVGGDQVAQADAADAAKVGENLALSARSRGDDTEALQDLLTAEKSAPNDARLLYDLGVLEDEMRLYWDADKVVSHLQAQPGGDQPPVLYLAARVKMDLGQLAAAEQLMRAYLHARPDDASAHYGLGRILQLQEHFAEATAQFEQSLALAPHQTESQFQLGEMALKQQQFQHAIDEYAKTLAGNPKHAGALAGTGIAWFRLQRYSKAEAELRQAIAADPQYQPAHYYLGLTLARLGQKVAAQQELGVASAMEQKQSEADAQRMHINQAPAGDTNSAQPHHSP